MQLRSVGVASLRVATQAAIDNFGETIGKNSVGEQWPQRWRRVKSHRHRQSRQIRLQKRRLTDEKLEQQRPQRVDITARRRGFPGKDLGRHVADSVTSAVGESGSVERLAARSGVSVASSPLTELTESWEGSSLASPKSSSLASPPSARIALAGFTSR